TVHFRPAHFRTPLSAFRTPHSRLRTLLMPPLHRQSLFDDFLDAEVPLPTLQSALAKFAAVSAADLRRNAKGAPVVGIAVERGSGGNQHALDERVVIQSPQEFLRRISRSLFSNQLQMMKRVIFSEFFQQMPR